MKNVGCHSASIITNGIREFSLKDYIPSGLINHQWNEPLVYKYVKGQSIFQNKKHIKDNVAIVKKEIN